MTTEVKFKPFREILTSGEIIFNLHKGQTKVRRSKARFTFMIGSPQSGKTCFGPLWLSDRIAEFGGGDYLAVSSTYDLFKLTMLPELLKTFEGGEIADKDGRAISYKVNSGRYWAGLRLIELAENLSPGKFWAKKENDPMWGRIILRSAEAKGGLVSATAKAAWVDEPGTQEFVREAWDNIKDRVAITRGPILGTGTIYCMNWMKSEIYLPWKRGDKTIDIIQVDALQNPAFPIEEYQIAKETLPSWKFNMKYRGIYDTPAGLIYDSFNEELCKIKNFRIPNHWPVSSGHDFGGANPGALFYAQVKFPLLEDAPPHLRQNDYVVWREYLPGSGRSISEHVFEFKKITEGYNVVKRVGGSPQEDEIRQGYSAFGWHISAPKISSVEMGIDRVYALHKKNMVWVFNDLINYIDEKQTYSRELDENYNPTEKIADKQRYHLMDCDRYHFGDVIPVEIDSEVGESRWD